MAHFFKINNTFFLKVNLDLLLNIQHLSSFITGYSFSVAKVPFYITMAKDKNRCYEDKRIINKHATCIFKLRKLLLKFASVTSTVGLKKKKKYIIAH